MNIYNINIKLKQVSPMLHFQGREDGATIRATELKPKLDRFILSWIAFENSKITWDKDALNSETLMLNNCVKELIKEHQDWFIDKTGEKHALNYKVRIIAGNRLNNIKDKCFGNAGYVLKQNKHEYSYYESIFIKIKCFNESLKNKIIELFPLFIDSTAFGLQQGKGYGNYRVKKIDDKVIDYSIEENIIKIKDHFSKDNDDLLIYKLKLTKGLDYVAVLNAIANYNRYLKSGLRYGRNYPSVLMKKYLKMDEKKREIINEKKAMKHKLAKNYNIDRLIRKDFQGKSIDIDNNMNASYDEEKVYYTRGILGFAPTYTYHLSVEENKDAFNKLPVNKQGVKKMFEKSFEVQAKIEKKEISRFPSPIHFHLHKNYSTVYLIIRNYQILKLQKYDTEIKFKEKFYDNEKQKNTREAIVINANILNQDQFDCKSFFEVAGLNEKISIAEIKDASGKIYKGLYYLKEVKGVK